MGSGLAAAVATVAVSLPPAYHPPASPLYEAPEARAERLAVVGAAVAASAQRATCAGAWAAEDCRRIWPGSTVELAGVLLGTGYLESGYAWHVHAGRCRVRIGECDAGRARSPWQLQRTSFTHTVWHELEGVGQHPTVLSAWAAARALAASRSRCARVAPREPWLTATIAGYARGNACTWKHAPRRARFVLSITGRIHQATRR